MLPGISVLRPKETSVKTKEGGEVKGKEWQIGVCLDTRRLSIVR